jgi:hypothetical protein
MNIVLFLLFWSSNLQSVTSWLQFVLVRHIYACKTLQYSVLTFTSLHLTVRDSILLFRSTYCFATRERCTVVLNAHSKVLPFHASLAAFLEAAIIGEKSGRSSCDSRLSTGKLLGFPRTNSGWQGILWSRTCAFLTTYTKRGCTYLPSVCFKGNLFIFLSKHIMYCNTTNKRDLTLHIYYIWVQKLS